MKNRAEARTAAAALYAEILMAVEGCPEHRLDELAAVFAQVNALLTLPPETETPEGT